MHGSESDSGKARLSAAPRSYELARRLDDQPQNCDFKFHPVELRGEPRGFTQPRGVPLFQLVGERRRKETDGKYFTGLYKLFEICTVVL